MTDTIEATSSLAANGGSEQVKPPPSLEQLAVQLMDRACEQGVSLVGPGGLLAGLTKTVLESALEAELTEHVGYDPYDRAGHNSGNSRNGTRTKTVLTEIGPVTLEVPRDRAGTFEPVIVPKRRRRLNGVDALVCSLSAKGLTHGEISAHLAEIYGAQVSKETITRITDRVLEGMSEWQNRPLDPVYPVIFIDAIVVKIREGQVANRPIYVAVGVTVDGTRDILGLWAGDGGEGAKYWHHVLTEIKNRGTKDVCIVVCDGLTGLADAVSSVWPQAIVQTCVIHLLRNSFRYASRKDWPAIAKDLKPIYTAADRGGRPGPLRRVLGALGGPLPGHRRVCGRTPGPSSCRSSASTPRSARSFTPPTPSRASTPESERRSKPGVISRPSRRP